MENPLEDAICFGSCEKFWGEKRMDSCSQAYGHSDLTSKQGS